MLGVLVYFMTFINPCTSNRQFLASLNEKAFVWIGAMHYLRGGCTETVMNDCNVRILKYLLYQRKTYIITVLILGILSAFHGYHAKTRFLLVDRVVSQEVGVAIDLFTNL